MPDALGMGLAVDADGVLLDAAGHPSPVLSALGPLRRGSHWECTAIPEIRAHAVRLASALAPS